MADDENPKTDGEPSHDQPRPILIKKYPNRRLYNTATSAYIVLDDIVELVRNGVEFVIEDKKSGEDITRSILNQIIFEQETKPSNYHFPLEVQKQLIAMYGDTYGQMMPDYLTESMKLFVSERDRMSEAMESVVGRNTRQMMEFSQSLARQNMELFRRSWEMFGGMAGRADQANEAAPGDHASGTSAASQGSDMDRSQELQQIQDKIDALQNRLKELK